MTYACKIYFQQLTDTVSLFCTLVISLTVSYWRKSVY